MTALVQKIEVDSSNIKVEEMSAAQAARWDRFVELHRAGTMYHLYGWKQVLERTFGYRSYYLAAMNESGEMVGVLPIFLMTDVFRKKYLVSNPFANFAGLCTSHPIAGRKLLKTAFEIAQRQNVQYIEFRQLGEPIDTELVGQPLPTKESFVTLMLNLADGRDGIWVSMSSRNRGKIRKAEKSGLVADSGKGYLEPFYHVLCHNLKFLGTPVHPLTFYRAIVEAFPDRANILVLRLQEKVASAMFIFQFKNVIAEPWVASLRQYNSLYANNLLYWKAIEYACERGFETFDFGRSTIDAGTFNFKVQWGAKPVRLYYQYFLHRASKIPVVDALNNQYQRYINIWKRLPLSATKIIGPRLVKYVPQL
jgi:FemAB-related protein (PEP-CTERM system-associated)